MIYVFFAHGFEEIEAVTPVDILRRAELEVVTVGIGAKTITGSHGITVHCDISDRETSSKNLEMIVLPGGLPGTLNLEKSKVVQAYIDHVIENGIWLGAICAAPSILGHKGVLAGKTVTCFPGYEEQLTGAVISPERVVQDGKLITGKGAGAAKEFSLRLVQCLLGKERADLLEASMQ
ncbi:MAG: DJ-1/PfpI family protein [Oscillospiraceae bacterium]|nr:DJ-1/PfpI family protein [Oscillospiraceae bacterium]